MPDRSAEITAAFQKVADAHDDPASIRARLAGGEGYVPPENPGPPNPTLEAVDGFVAAAYEEFCRTHEVDPKEQCYKVFIHHGIQDRFVEYDVFLSLDDAVEVPAYEDWGALGV